MARTLKNDRSLSNMDVVILAAFRLGGSVNPIDTEDIAVISNQLAPGRFNWKKYTDQINLEHIRVYLTDAHKDAKGHLIDGNVSDGWMLTAAGVEHAKKLDAVLPTTDLSRAKKTKEEERLEKWLATERKRVASSPTIRAALKEGSDKISRPEIERLFKIDKYIVGKSRERKVSRLVNACSSDPELHDLMKSLAERILED